MKRKHLLFALRVFVLLILQIVVCNELFLWRFATPFVYPVLLFFFPLGTKKYLYTLSGGIVGLIIDAASGAAGLHTAAFTLTAFLFGYMLPYFVVTDAQPGVNPSIQRDGSKPFVLLLLVLLFHHFVLFFLDAVGAPYTGFLALRMLGSLAVSYVIAAIILLVTNRRSE